jgi:hypothetical protein
MTAATAATTTPSATATTTTTTTTSTTSANTTYSSTAAANRSGHGDLFVADDARQEDFRLLHDEDTDFLHDNEL